MNKLSEGHGRGENFRSSPQINRRLSFVLTAFLVFFSGEVRTALAEDSCYPDPETYAAYVKKTKRGLVELKKGMDQQSIRIKTLNLINGVRDKNGFSPVKLDPRLNNIAQGHADHMADARDFNHTWRDGTTLRDRFVQGGESSYCQYEVIGRNYFVRDMVDLWTDPMACPEHRKIILQNRLTTTGEKTGRSYEMFVERIGVGVTIPTEETPYLVVNFSCSEPRLIK